jgi:hypothetical protein
MAFLSTRTDGEAQGTIDSHWYNDFMQVLTGAMNDQPLYLYYEPSVGTNPPALKLQTNGNAHLLTGLTSAGATAFDFDASGNLTAGKLSFDGGDITSDGSGDLYMSGQLNFGTQVSGDYGILTYYPAGNEIVMRTPQSGVANAISFQVWNGSSGYTPFAIGSTNGNSYIDGSGNFKASGAATVSGAIISNNWIQNNPLGNGGNWMWMYRSTVTSGATVNKDWVQVYDGSSGNIYFYDNTDSLTAWAALPTGVLEIGTSRNGSPQLVPIYTGTSTPSSPPTGSIWIKA